MLTASFFVPLWVQIISQQSLLTIENHFTILYKSPCGIYWLLYLNSCFLTSVFSFENIPSCHQQRYTICNNNVQCFQFPIILYMENFGNRANFRLPVFAGFICFQGLENPKKHKISMVSGCSLVSQYVIVFVCQYVSLVCGDDIF